MTAGLPVDSVSPLGPVQALTPTSDAATAVARTDAKAVRRGRRDMARLYEK